MACFYMNNNDETYKATVAINKTIIPIFLRFILMAFFIFLLSLLMKITSYSYYNIFL